MRWLLDTHIWLWSHLQPTRLSPGVVAVLEDPASELWLSAISVWELTVLVERGRVSLTTEIADWVHAALDAAPMHQAPITTEIALATRCLTLDHHDPADRFIAATAVVHDLTLITADHRLLAAPTLRTLANR